MAVLLEDIFQHVCLPGDPGLVFLHSPVLLISLLPFFLSSFFYFQILLLRTRQYPCDIICISIILKLKEAQSRDFVGPFGHRGGGVVLQIPIFGVPQFLGVCQSSSQMAGYFVNNKLFLSLETGTITTSDTPPDQYRIDLMALPLRDLVKAFNALPTIKTLPTGVKNHWHFTIRRAYLDRPDDILHLVNPADGFTHMVGPRELRGLPEEEKVAVVVRLLLECFVHGMPRWLSTEINAVAIPHHEQEQATSSTVGRDVNNNNNATNQVRYAPWTWGTQDTELARAVEERMKDIGVGHKRLTKVATGNVRDELASMRSLLGFHECLIQDMTKVIVKGFCKCTLGAPPIPAEEGGSSSRCDDCGRLLDIESIASAVVRIRQHQTAGVEQSENLSIGGPREANIDTKAIANRTQDNVEPDDDDDDATIYNPYPENDYQNPLDFYNSMPHTLPEACDLADNIGLNLPQGDGGPPSQGILYIIPPFPPPAPPKNQVTELIKYIFVI
jgi:hypothetical protein